MIDQLPSDLVARLGTQSTDIFGIGFGNRVVAHSAACAELPRWHCDGVRAREACILSRHDGGLSERGVSGNEVERGRSSRSAVCSDREQRASPLSGMEITSVTRWERGDEGSYLYFDPGDNHHPLALAPLSWWWAERRGVT